MTNAKRQQEGGYARSYPFVGIPSFLRAEICTDLDAHRRGHCRDGRAN